MRSIFIPHLGKIGLAYFLPFECEVAHTSRALIRRVEPARAGGLAHDAADFEHRERGSQDRDREAERLRGDQINAQLKLDRRLRHLQWLRGRGLSAAQD